MLPAVVLLASSLASHSSTAVTQMNNTAVNKIDTQYCCDCKKSKNNTSYCSLANGIPEINSGRCKKPNRINAAERSVASKDQSGHYSRLNKKQTWQKKQLLLPAVPAL